MIIFIIFIIVGIIWFIIDKSTNGCTTKLSLKDNFILFFHHIISTFIGFGWLSNNKIFLKYYIYVPLINVAIWKFNYEKCPLADIKYSCKTNDKRFLRDISYYLGIKNTNNYYQLRTMYMLLAAFLAFVRLNNK